MTRRQQQAQETKWHIFATAMEMFNRRPFEKVTIKDICAASEVSVGAFYHHFQSKEHLLLEAYKIIDKVLWGSTKTLRSTDIMDKIIEYMGMYAQSAEDDGPVIVTEVYRVLLTLRQTFPMDYNNGVMAGLLGLLEEAQAQGRIRPELDARALTLELLIVARGVLYFWCQTRGAFSIRERTIEMVRPHLEYYSRKP